MRDKLSALDLVGVWQVVYRHWKLIASFVVATILITTFLLFFVLPKYYKSTGVIIAANPVLADKSRLFNDNVQHLYSPYGDVDDLNRLAAIARLDTVYLQLVQEFKLSDNYEEEGKAAMKKAMANLKDDIHLMKTENDELHISAVTKNRETSAFIVNRMIEIISSIAEKSWRLEYSSSIEALQQQVEQTEMELAAIADSIKSGATLRNNEIAILSKRAALVEQLQQFYKTINQYKVAINNQPSALVVLQKAYPAFTHHKPKKGEVLLLAFIAAIAFSIIAVLVYDRTLPNG